MHMPGNRRQFLSWSGATAGLAIAAAATTTQQSLGAQSDTAPRKLLFSSQGKTGIADINTLRVKYLQLDAPGQATWQVSGVFPDHQRLIVLSMEPRRDGPGRPFDEYYTQTPTHIWLYDLASEQLEEICHRDRLAPFVTPALLISKDRMLVQVVKNKVGQIYSVDLDGSNPREFTKAGEGLPYGLSLSPDGQRVAFHLASPQGYQVWTSDIQGNDRILIAAAPGHLYFGTQWSPDGRWILFVDCLHQNDPGHDWADVCIGPADGMAAHRVLTSGQAMWFAATYGDQRSRGGGSNVPAWTPDGQIVFPRRTPGAKVPWQYRVGQPDLDHFNRELKPEAASGGVHLCALEPLSGKLIDLTTLTEGVWDFRGMPASDGQYLAFCRAKTSGASELWLLDCQSKQTQRITAGIDDLGADHPRWI